MPQCRFIENMFGSFYKFAPLQFFIVTKTIKYFPHWDHNHLKKISHSYFLNMSANIPSVASLASTTHETVVNMYNMQKFQSSEYQHSQFVSMQVQFLNCLCLKHHRLFCSDLRKIQNDLFHPIKLMPTFKPSKGERDITSKVCNHSDQAKTKKILL